MFGELSLFDPGPRTATATAVTATTLSGLGNDALDPLLSQRPEVAGRLLAALARRLRRTNEAMADLIFSDVPGRVAKALLDLAQRFGVETEDGLRVTHDLTQEELAQLVGASRETVNKALADFAAPRLPAAGRPGRGDPRPRAPDPPRRLTASSPASAAARPPLGRALEAGRGQLRLGGQVVELGPHRELGGRPQGLVDVGIDHPHHLGRRRRARGHRRRTWARRASRWARYSRRQRGRVGTAPARAPAGA